MPPGMDEIITELDMNLTATAKNLIRPSRPRIPQVYTKSVSANK